MPGYGPDPGGGGDTSALALEAGGNLADVKTATETTATETGTMDTAIGTVSDAKVETDAAGSLSAKMRGMVSRLAELITQLGSVGAAADADGTIHAQLRYIAENPGSVSTVTANAGTDLNTSALALENGGVLDDIATDAAAMETLLGTIDADTGAISTVSGTTADAAVSTDTTGTISGKLRGLVKLFAAAFGSVGAAADVDGVVHGQLRYIGEALDSVVSPLLGLDKTSYGNVTDVATDQISLSSDASAATGATIAAGLYIITSNVDCHIETGASPVATAAHDALWAKTYRYLYVASALKVAAIVDTSGDTGTVTINLLKAD
jgi:hypothetical protein